MLKPRYGVAVPLDRGFVHLGFGAMHYRAAGAGPVVLALHESPRSSITLLPVIEALSQRYRVIAPDSPGYGLSDPVPGDAPELGDYIDAFIAFLDALGLRRVGLYGAHTGAAFATELAARHPDRFTVVVLDGLSAFTDEEIDSFRTDYLPPYAPDWEGRHVMGAWSRAKDVATWFPWHERSERARLAFDPPGLEIVQASARGLIQSGGHYDKGYVRAAEFQSRTRIRDVTIPTTIMARASDLLAFHLDRLDTDGPWKIEWLPTDTGAWYAAMTTAMERGDTPDPQLRAASAPATGSQMIAWGEGWLHVVHGGVADGPLRVLIPDLPGDAADLLARQAALHPQDRLLAIDPPGCGYSDPLAARDAGLNGVVDGLEAVLTALGLKPSTIVAQGAAAVVAAIWIGRMVEIVPLQIIEGPTWLTDTRSLPVRSPLEALEPALDGRHMTTAWFQLRDWLQYDTPPLHGPVTRRPGTQSGPTVADLDRLYRLYMEGPEAAQVLADSIEHLRRDPGLLAG